MPLVHMIYCSAATVATTPEMLQTLLISSRQYNRLHNITGVLLCREGSFFQILEGEQDEVEALYQKIARDDRHHLVQKIICEPISQRDFPAWTMGYIVANNKELATIPGLGDFFDQEKAFAELDEGRTKTLLKAFNAGLWHAKIEDGVQIHHHG